MKTLVLVAALLFIAAALDDLVPNPFTHQQSYHDKGPPSATFKERFQGEAKGGRADRRPVIVTPAIRVPVPSQTRPRFAWL